MAANTNSTPNGGPMNVDPLPAKDPSSDIGATTPGWVATIARMREQLMAAEAANHQLDEELREQTAANERLRLIIDAIIAAVS
jgi:hypothetical protein